MFSWVRQTRLPLPTRLGAGYFLVSVMLLAFGQFTGNLAASTLGFGILLPFLVCFLAVLAARGRLRRLDIVFSPTGHKSWKLSLGATGLLRFFSLSFAYRWTFTGDRYLQEEIPILPRFQLEKTLDAARGLYTGPSGKLVLCDPFHWWRFTTDVPGQVEFFVLPTPTEKHNRAIVARAQGSRGIRKGHPGERDDRLDTRPYYPGDDIRHLHWKLFAHTGELILRKSDPTPPPRRRWHVLLDPWLPHRTEGAMKKIDTLVIFLMNLLERGREPQADMAVAGPDFWWTDAHPLREMERWLASLRPDLPGKIIERNWTEGSLVLAHPEAPRVQPFRATLIRRGVRWLGPEEWG